MDCMKFRLFIF